MARITHTKTTPAARLTSKFKFLLVCTSLIAPLIVGITAGITPAKAVIANPTPSDFKVLLSPTTKTKCIATNVEIAWCEFTYQVTDPTVFDPKFIEALSYRMGASLAQSLAGNIQLGQSLLQMSIGITDKAVLENSKEGSKQKPNYSSLIESR